MRVLASIVVIPVVFVGWQWWSDHSLERRLAPIASGISGRPIQVDCQSIWGSLIDVQGREGEVFVSSDGTAARKLFLTRRMCKRLRAFAGASTHHELDCLRAIDWQTADPLPFTSECYRRASPTIYAVLVLAHESFHTAGSLDEAATNCFAIQAMAWTATQLGAPATEAELLAASMEALEPNQGSDYATGDCHAGLRLDLHPETPEFPTEHPIAPPNGLGRFVAS